MKEEHTCCFIGHRKIPNVEEIAKELANKLECLIREEKVVTFLFGSRSDFDAPRLVRTKSLLQREKVAAEG